MTGLKAALSNIQKPSTQALKIIEALNKQGANINFSAAGLQSKGLAQFLQDIKNATGGNQAILAQLFGSTEALNAVNVLIGSGEELFNKSLQEMQNSMGTTEAAFEQMMNTPEKRFEKVKNTIRNAGISLGTALLPAIEKIVEKIVGIADSFAKIDFSKYTGSIDRAFSAVGTFIDALIGAVKIAWRFRGVIMAIVTVMGLFYGISMAVVGVTNLYNKIMKIKNIITSIGTGYQIAYAAVVGGSASATAALGFATKETTVAFGVWSFVLTVSKKAIDAVKRSTIAQAIAAKGTAIATGIATAAQWAFNIAATANPIGLIIMGVAAAIAAIIGIIILLKKHWDKITEAIKNNVNKVMTVLTILCGPIGIIISMIKEIAANWGRIKNALAATGLFDKLKKIGMAIKNFIQPAIDWLIGIWETVKNAVGGFFRYYSRQYQVIF